MKTDDVDPEIKKKFENSEMSKAGKIAMELSQERKRLREELAQLQSEVDDLTPTTPVGTFDWYVKWMSTIFAVLGIFSLSAGFEMVGQILYVIASIGWVVVGMQCGDRAIMIGSSISGTSVALNLVELITRT